MSNRTRAIASAGAVLVALSAGSLAGTAVAAPVPNDPGAQTPTLEFSNDATQSLLGSAYTAALENVLVKNTVPYDDAIYNSTGLLDASPGTFLKAGSTYDQPWTRDAAVNSWNAGSVLEPDTARNTLWAVVTRQDDGSLIVQQDDQWWDQVVWVTGAWNHYLVTGDAPFLDDAYEASMNTLEAREGVNFDADANLFMGPSFFNDGISGYPSPPADDGETRGGFVLSYPGVEKEFTLSTNAVYYQAYVNTARMASELGRPDAEVTAYEQKAETLKASINENFWIPDEGTYGYLLHNDDSEDGILEHYQEGAGLSFAILFGIADDAQADSIMQTTELSTWGITDVSPSFERYSAERPGRHNVSVWPMVQGYWASAAAQRGEESIYADEVVRLAKLAGSSDGFFEVYNAETGAVDGGWQTGAPFTSVADQTWSASAYLRMIYDGLFGVQHTTEGVTFSPTLPAGWGDATLSDLTYRNATLTVNLRGAGDVVESFMVDGEPVAGHSIPADISGEHVIDITLGGAEDGDRDGDDVGDSSDTCPDQAGPVESSGCVVDQDGDAVLDVDDLCPALSGSTALEGCVDPEYLEAEDAELTGVTANTNHTGYTGTGFVDTFYDDGDAATFSLYRPGSAAGSGTLTVRYANGNDGDRTLSLRSGEVSLGQATLPPTGGWDTWGTIVIEDVPVVGKVTALELSKTSADSGRINVDAISFISGEVSIVSALPDPQPGIAYSQQLVAIGGQSPYTFEVTEGSLPGGLSLSSSGSLTGTPGGSGSTFTVTTTDSADRVGAREYDLTVSADYSPSIAVTPGTVEAGGTISVRGSGFAPGDSVTVTLESDTVLLGTVSADDDGEFTAEFTVPADTTPGAHTITSVGAASGDATPFALTVIAPVGGDSGPAGPDGPGGAAGPEGSGSAGGANGLALTGADIAGAVGVAAALIVAGGVFLLFRRRHRGGAMR